jgi:hypothetical protein
MGFIGAMLLVGVCACRHGQQYRIAVAPSLRPVDAARPIVVFSQLRGEACGRDAVAGALRDMKRLREVDGYVEVVVEETGEGDERCARATAYPFRYGENTSEPSLNAGEESTAPVLVPGRAALLPPVGTSSPPVVPDGNTPHGIPADCPVVCERAVNLLGLPTIQRALQRDRCTQRCKTGDAEFQRCVSDAVDANAVQTCLQP